MIEEIMENSQMKLHKFPKKAYQDCLQKWQWHWERCINAGGEYLEDNKAHSVPGMSKRTIRKRVLKLFEQTMYLLSCILLLSSSYHRIF
jgi:hypothetical protein